MADELNAQADIDGAVTRIYCEACGCEIPSTSRLSEKGLLQVFTHACSCGRGESVRIVREKPNRRSETI